jgi:hypothetical protein
MVLMRKSLLSIILSGQVRHGPAGRLAPRFPDRTRVEVSLDHIGNSGKSSLAMFPLPPPAFGSRCAPSGITHQADLITFRSGWTYSWKAP